MVSANGTLYLATTQNNSNRSLFIFSSTDGYNWGAHQDTGILMGADPGLALYNGGYGLAFKSKTSTNYFSAFAY
jgi:hypothetical protein